MWHFLVRIPLHLSKPIFAYLIHSFRYILKSKGTINYLSGSMENIPDIIKQQKPSLIDWSVTRTVVMTMRYIVGIIVKNQASGSKWIISEAIVETLRVYIYFSGDEVDEVLKVGLDQRVEEQDGLA